MEDTLRVSFVYRKKDGSVLILVLMEDTLRVYEKIWSSKRNSVLILVLMEDTLREYETIWFYRFSSSLNPCFNGRYSQRSKKLIRLRIRMVLILVLMEDTLRERFYSILNVCKKDVLILVLMEDTLREQRLVSLCLSSFDVCLPL